MGPRHTQLIQIDPNFIPCPINTVFFRFKKLLPTELKYLNIKGTGRKIRKLLIVFLLTVAGIPIAAGQDFEVGPYVGGAYYLGDLNPGGHFKSPQLAYGIIARYNLDMRWAVKLNAFRGKVKGNSSQSTYLPDRQLSFESNVTDISGVIEFNFIPYFTGSQRHKITPYIYAGVGVFFFNPMNGGTELRPLGTEGQNEGYEGRKPYSLTSVNIPFGIGMKLSAGKRLGFTVFWEMHKTFSDYLDDVSTTYYLYGPEINPDSPEEYLSDPSMSKEPGMQRGNSRDNDWYSFSGLTITYKFALGNARKCRDLESN